MKKPIKVPDAPRPYKLIRYEEIQRIKGLMQVKESVSSIARMMGCSRSAVSAVVCKIRNGQESLLKYSVVGPYHSPNNKIVNELKKIKDETIVPSAVA